MKYDKRQIARWRSERMCNINRIRETLDDDNATPQQIFGALRQEKIWEEVQDDIQARLEEAQMRRAKEERE